ncbi:MAG: DUF1330 domain-containing protein [Hyphomicrobiales bacterium]|nr:MAG: DUF1330 domain-containing protein [Hyphomicrobiales bacterium]
MLIRKNILAGLALSIVATTWLQANDAHAQPAPAATGPAIYVSEFEVTDPDGMKPYSASVEASFASFGGRYIVRGGSVVSQEGTPSKRIVMIEFPSMAQALAWYDSPAYAQLKPIRHRYATSRVYTVQGTPRQP